jgi:hypothetical protein
MDKVVFTKDNIDNGEVAMRNNESIETNDFEFSGLKTIRILYILHTVLYLPFMQSFLPIWLFVLFLRCFFIPYIATVILAGLYIWLIKKQELAPPDEFLFPVMLIINIISFVSMETGFAAAMGI